MWSCCRSALEPYGSKVSHWNTGSQLDLGSLSFPHSALEKSWVLGYRTQINDRDWPWRQHAHKNTRYRNMENYQVAQGLTSQENGLNFFSCLWNLMNKTYKYYLDKLGATVYIVLVSRMSLLSLASKPEETDYNLISFKSISQNIQIFLESCFYMMWGVSLFFPKHTSGCRHTVCRRLYRL